jgi:hypothetical protein
VTTNSENIVREIAKHAANRLARKTIRYLQSLKDCLQSGEDSGLANVWDEICVQVQQEESFFWNAYDETVRQFVAGYVEQLPLYERQALWLSTDQGMDWDAEDRDGDPPILHDDIVEYIVQHHVYTAAENHSNARISRYLERQQS